MGRAHEVRAASMAKTAAIKSKLYSRYGKELYIAAKSGVPDPDMNLALKRKIQEAKSNQVPADVIKRAIEKAKGGTDENYTEARYEGFGPNNSMLIIECLTDNENRTLTAVKTALSRCGCKLGVAGCVRHMFNYYAVFSFEGLSDEEALEAVMAADCDVVDIFNEDGVTTVYADSSNYQEVKQALLNAKADLVFLEDTTTYVPQTTVELTDEKEVAQFNRLRDMLDEIDDVQDLFHNIVNLPDEEEE